MVRDKFKSRRMLEHIEPCDAHSEKMIRNGPTDVPPTTCLKIAFGSLSAFTDVLLCVAFQQVMTYEGQLNPFNSLCTYISTTSVNCFYFYCLFMCLTLLTVMFKIELSAIFLSNNIIGLQDYISCMTIKFQNIKFYKAMFGCFVRLF